MKISIVIPNYNGEGILLKNLPRVLSAVESSSLESEMIISDDFSTDKSVEIIKEFINVNKKSPTKLKLLESKVNKGFSTNVDRGVNEAIGEIVILLNTDVIPSKNFIEFLLPHFSDSEVFAVGCMDESVEDNERIVLRGRGKGVWRRGFLNHSAADLSGLDTLWVSGGSGAFRKSIWDKLGGLDKIYDPFYWEDIDLSYRARKSGYKTLFEKRSVVRHEHEKGAIKSKYKSNQIKKTVYRNQFIFAWKNADLSNLLKNILWLPYHLINATISRDFAMLYGFAFAITRLSRIISSRNKSKKFFIKSDREAIYLSN